MAFYIVMDSVTNEYGDSDTFVVRAGGTRQAAKIAGVDPKTALVEKLESGRNEANGIMLASLVDFGVTPPVTPATDYDSTLVETETTEDVADPYAAYTF